jgi:RNA polymerase sigma factor (sigma-70 family)
MRWESATNKQIKTILEDDREIPSYLLLEAIEEAIKRDMYKNLIYTLMIKLFSSQFVAEKITNLAYEDLKQICYIEMYKAAKSFKPGKNHFISYWARFVRMELMTVARDAKAEKREINEKTIPIYDKENEEAIQLADGKNVEKTVVTKLYLDYLFQYLTPKQLEVVELMRMGHKYTDIAEILGMDRKAVEMRFIHGRKKIMEGIGA